MRGIVLLVALCAAGATAQVQFAPKDRTRGGQRRRVTPVFVRRQRPEVQQAEEQNLIPYQDKSDRQSFGPPSPAPQSFRPAPSPPQTVPPSFLPQDYRGGSTAAPPAARPGPPRRPSQPAGGRGGGRYRPQQNDYQDEPYQDDRDSQLSEDEDYELEEEPDKLSELLAKSTFRCDPSATGYFADDSVNCEVFHYCAAGVKHSWVCPDGNQFHQINLICQPAGSDNICERSSDYHFVNDYLYQQVNNDSLNPLYADRYYPQDYLPGGDGRNDLVAGPEPHGFGPQGDRRYQPEQRQQQQRRPERRRRPVQQLGQPDFGPAPGRGPYQDSAGFRQPQAPSVIRATQTSRPDATRRPVAPAPQPSYRPQPQQFRPESNKDSGRPQQRPVEDFDPDALRQQVQREQRPLPQVPVYRPTFPTSQPLPPAQPQYRDQGATLQPSLNYRGAPRQQQDGRGGSIVLGGFQGNVDIEDLAARSGRRYQGRQ